MPGCSPWRGDTGSEITSTPAARYTLMRFSKVG